MFVCTADMRYGSGRYESINFSKSSRESKNSWDTQNIIDNACMDVVCLSNIIDDASFIEADISLEVTQTMDLLFNRRNRVFMDVFPISNEHFRPKKDSQ